MHYNRRAAGPSVLIDQRQYRVPCSLLPDRVLKPPDEGPVTAVFEQRRSVLTFWLGCAAVTAGVLTHVPMFLMGRSTHYVLAGMPMGTPMLWGMAAIVAG